LVRVAAFQFVRAAESVSTSRAVRGVHVVEPCAKSERRSDLILHQVGALECPATVSLVRVVRGLNTPETRSVCHVRLQALPEVSTPHEGHDQVGELIVVFFTVTSHETYSASNHTLTLEVLKV
jgi:hypothetical protein